MKRIETLLIILGLAFYVWFLRRLGPAHVYSYVRLAGWGVLLTIGIESIARLANTLGWRVTIERYPRELKFSKLFAARVAGEAIDYVTPSAQIGGQFVMALMVRHKLKMAAGLATVVVGALAEAVGQIGFITIALLLTLRLVAAMGSLFWPVAAGLAIAVGLAAGFFWVQTKQPFLHLWKAAARLKLPGLATTEIKAASAEADALLNGFYARHRLRLLLSCLCYLLAWSLGPVEIYILMVLLKQPTSAGIVLVIEALGLLLERATFMIPAKLVSQEGGKALLLGLLGYPAGVGFAIGLLRRIKEMVWVLLGLVFLFAHRLTEQEESIEPVTQRRSAIAE